MKGETHPVLGVKRTRSQGVVQPPHIGTLNPCAPDSALTHHEQKPTPPAGGAIEGRAVWLFRNHGARRGRVPALD